MKITSCILSRKEIKRAVCLQNTPAKVVHEGEVEFLIRKAMQKEIDHLKKKLRRERRRRTPSFSDPSSEDSQGSSYRPRSRTPPSESFSYEEDYFYGHTDKKFSSKGLGNDGGYDVKKVMVNQGSGADIMYPDLFKRLSLRLEDLMAYDSPLISFEGKAIIPKGQIRLLVQSGSEVVEVDFIVVYAYSPYTAIVARLWLHALGAVSATLHLKVKFLSEDQVEELIGSQSVARQCMAAAILHQPGPEFLASAEGSLQLMSLAMSRAAAGEDPACEELEKVLVNDDLEKFFQVGVQLLSQEKVELVMFLKRNVDVFVWNAYEAPGVMPFGLKNTGATYQRMMTKMFESQLGKTIEVYVDDMVLKSKTVSMHVEDLNNTFQTLRRYKLRLNASKCSFGVGSGKFLGYMVTHRGIEVNPA
ncbi:uncharacterized protein LOC142620526 [Castanea sativa]|uniref:uncharacterized protein LOC142620526 n=1 Tax=Castanea sativa TaxID=21020 RepID=UPI003F64BA26